MLSYMLAKAPAFAGRSRLVNNNKQLTQGQRYSIERMLKERYKQARIAERLTPT